MELLSQYSDEKHYKATVLVDNMRGTACSKNHIKLFLDNFWNWCKSSKMNRIFAQRKTNISNIGFYAKVTIASNIDNFFQFYFICLKPSQYALSFICLFSFFLVILFRVRIFTLSLSYGSKFSSTCNLGSLLGLS